MFLCLLLVSNSIYAQEDFQKKSLSLEKICIDTIGDVTLKTDKRQPYISARTFYQTSPKHAQSPFTRWVDWAVIDRKGEERFKHGMNFDFLKVHDSQKKYTWKQNIRNFYVTNLLLSGPTLTDESLYKETCIAWMLTESVGQSLVGVSKFFSENVCDDLCKKSTILYYGNIEAITLNNRFATYFQRHNLAVLYHQDNQQMLDVFICTPEDNRALEKYATVQVPEKVSQMQWLGGNNMLVLTGNALYTLFPSRNDAQKEKEQSYLFKKQTFKNNNGKELNILKFSVDSLRPNQFVVVTSEKTLLFCKFCKRGLVCFPLKGFKEGPAHLKFGWNLQLLDNIVAYQFLTNPRDAQLPIDIKGDTYFIDILEEQQHYTYDAERPESDRIYCLNDDELTAFRTKDIEEKK